MARSRNSGGKRPGAGRKAIDIDVENLEKLCMLHCTDEELAAFFSVSTRTIESRRKQPQFAEVMSRGKAKGRIAVRRQQMKLMEAGSASMCIWLGKQLLGQRDVTPIELSGPSGERLSLGDLDAAIARAKDRAKSRSGR